MIGEGSRRRDPAAEAGEVTLAVSQHIICEVVFVLEGQGYSRTDICGALTRFAAIKGITVQDSGPVLTALVLYRGLNVDFADALLHSIASYRGGRLWTFNKNHFRRMGEG